MKKKIHVGRDLLDAQVVDRDREPMGRVDGITITMEEGKQPRLASIDLGSGVLFRRLGTRLGDAIERLENRLTSGSSAPLSIPFEKILHGGLDVKVDLKLAETTANAFENWLREKIIGRIPGA